MAGTKTVTRRMGWEFLKPGDRVLGVEKGMGLKKGEKVRGLGVIEIVSVRREMLDDLWLERKYPYGAQEELQHEGFPGMERYDFVEMFAKHHDCTTADFVTRIEFRHVRPTEGTEILVKHDPAICYGAPCIAGTRIPCEVIYGAYDAGESIEDIAVQFGVSENEALGAIDYWARHKHEYTQRESDTVKEIFKKEG